MDFSFSPIINLTTYLFYLFVILTYFKIYQNHLLNIIGQVMTTFFAERLKPYSLFDTNRNATIEKIVNWVIITVVLDSLLVFFGNQFLE